MGSRIRVWRIALATLGSVLVFGLHATASDVEVSSPVTPEGSTSSREINGIRRTSCKPLIPRSEPMQLGSFASPQALPPARITRPQSRKKRRTPRFRNGSRTSRLCQFGRIHRAFTKTISSTRRIVGSGATTTRIQRSSRNISPKNRRSVPKTQNPSCSIRW